jgi:hypothetical protein
LSDFALTDLAGPLDPFPVLYNFETDETLTVVGRTLVKSAYDLLREVRVDMADCTSRCPSLCRHLYASRNTEAAADQGA